MSEVKRKGKAAKQVSYSLVNLTTEAKNEALEKIAVQLLKDKNFLLQENQKISSMEDVQGCQMQYSIGFC